MRERKVKLIRIGRLKVWLIWEPNRFTRLWKGGKIAISFLYETDYLKRIRGKHATRKS